MLCWGGGGVNLPMYVGIDLGSTLASAAFKHCIVF